MYKVFVILLINIFIINSCTNFKKNPFIIKDELRDYIGAMEIDSSPPKFHFMNKYEFKKSNELSSYLNHYYSKPSRSIASEGKNINKISNKQLYFLTLLTNTIF